MNRAIIYFTKLPKLGHCKTRLEGFLPKPTILHLANHLIQKNYQAICETGIDTFVFLKPDAHESLTDINTLLSPAVSSIQLFEQSGQDLGERMATAISTILDKGYDSVLLIGSDLFDLSKDKITHSFELLASHDVVINPTLDGGYGIIGMSAPHPDIFNLEAFSHEHVFDQTIDLIKQAGLNYAVGDDLLDIDKPEDIAKALAGDYNAKFYAKGEYNANFLINGGKELLRIALDSQMHLDNQIAYEYKALEALESSGVVPKVLKLVENTELIERGYLIEEFVHGRPLDYTTDLEIAASLLASVHSVDIEKGSHLIHAKQPFQTMYNEFIELFAKYQSWDQKDPEAEQLISGMLEQIKAMGLDDLIEHPSIINTELNSHNFIINPEGNSYVIDWEKPLISDKEQDLAHFLVPTTTLWKTDVAFDSDDLRTFITHYNRVSMTGDVDESKLNKYMIFTCLRGITWCAMAAVQYHEALSNNQEVDDYTHNVIKEFTSIPFLENIKATIDSGGFIKD